MAATTRRRFRHAHDRGIRPAKDESASLMRMLCPLSIFLATFKGFKIARRPAGDRDYTDNLADAELIASLGDWWPTYGFGEASWGPWRRNMAEAGGEVARTGKADGNSVEWTNFVGGPSLDILNKYLDQAIAESTIPFEPTLGQYITADEAATRYANLKAWFGDHGHFWSTTGPYILDAVDLNAKTALVANNPDFPDLANRWSSFSTPPLAEALLDGPSQVKIGEATDFTVSVTTQAGDPYPAANIKQVKFLVYNDQGETVFVGEGVPGASEGEYTLTITPDAQLTAGAGKIEAAIVLVPAAIPAFASLEFVATP
jgi:peptide/nickel transport system substrate-binding protein